MKLIKAILTKRFELELFRDKDDMYYVIHTGLMKSSKSQGVTDFNLASYLFDLKLAEVGGN